MPMTRPNHWIAVTTLATMAACGRADIGVADSSVVARINGSAILAQQVDHAVTAAAPGLSAEHAGKLTAQALEQLIDEELLMQEALALQLDRLPAVQDTIAAERRRILGMAYLRSDEPALTAADVSEFFAAHPRLFAQRRIYQTHELVAAVPAMRQPELANAIDQAEKLDDVAHWFKTQGIYFREAASTLPAERIPTEVLRHLAEMDDGEVTVVASPEIVLVVQLIHAQDAPLTEDEAAPAIREALDAMRLKELLDRTVRRLRRQARIEYEKTPVPEAPANSTRPALTNQLDRDVLNQKRRLT
jgi:EpsD family peptidyl-prolyl cis-trans isomerase